MTTRLLQPKPKPRIQAPRTLSEWQKLMNSAIERATETKAKLLPGLRDAQAKGQVEAFLRRLGIIHQNDIDRLFPLSNQK
jgi:hypothetical protein